MSIRKQMMCDLCKQDIKGSTFVSTILIEAGYASDAKNMSVDICQRCISVLQNGYRLGMITGIQMTELKKQ